MVEYGEGAVGLYADAFVAACVGINVDVAEAVVGLVITFEELIGGAKAVHKGRQSALAVRV